MLAKKNRLVTKKDIQKAFKTKFRITDKNFNIWLSYKRESQFQALIIVSKKIFKQAVKRNRIKHKLLSALFEIQKDIELGSHKLIIQVKSKQILKMSSSLILPVLKEKLTSLKKTKKT